MVWNEIVRVIIIWHEDCPRVETRLFVQGLVKVKIKYSFYTHLYLKLLLNAYDVLAIGSPYFEANFYKKI